MTAMLIIFRNIAPVLLENTFTMHVVNQLNREGNPLPENRLSLDIRAYIEAFLFRAIERTYSKVEINLWSAFNSWQNFKKYLIGSNAFSIPLKPNIPVKCLAANIYLLHLVTKVTNSLNREQVRCENILPHLLLCSESITRKLVYRGRRKDFRIQLISKLCI